MDSRPVPRDESRDRQHVVYYGLTDGTTRALVSDLVPARARATAFGIFQGVMGIALLPASLIMGMLYGRYAGKAFLLGAALALISAVGVLFVVPSKTKRDAEREVGE
jgi:MFS family permease